ncbi:MAG: hypothetical protein JWO59_2302 [Chloroflexi bacterium]|nr:hypothetical protein [Chloroflexota bacterium]
MERARLISRKLQARQKEAQGRRDCSSIATIMVLAAAAIYQGSVNSTSFRVGELFREAVRHNATALILVHNHPSGDPTPSPEGVQFTRTLVEAGKMMDIEVLDHLVIGRGKYVSLKERRLGY